MCIVQQYNIMGDRRNYCKGEARPKNPYKEIQKCSAHVENFAGGRPLTLAPTLLRTLMVAVYNELHDPVSLVPLYDSLHSTYIIHQEQM